MKDRIRVCVLQAIGAGLLSESLLGLGDSYVRLSDGRVYFPGERPGPNSHKHGCCSKRLVMLVGGRRLEVVVLKQRWLEYGTTMTCHSRPPEDIDLVRFCSSIVVLRLAAVLFTEAGFHNRAELFEGLEECGSDRTVQRWLARAQAQAVEIAQAIRLMLIMRIEPRPLETMFPGGLSPPRSLIRKHWKHTEYVAALWSGYTMLLVAAREHGRPLSVLLAEARRRCQSQKIPFGL